MKCERSDTAMPTTKHKEYINIYNIIGYSPIFYLCRHIKRTAERIPAPHTHTSRGIDNLYPLANRIGYLVIQCVPIQIRRTEVVSCLCMNC